MVGLIRPALAVPQPPLAHAASAHRAVGRSPLGCGRLCLMAIIQTPEEIKTILARLEGQRIVNLQVLGVNSLKSFSPPLDALTDDAIEGYAVSDRLLTLTTTRHRVAFDLQRTGKLVWLPRAEPYSVAAGSVRPTVRLLLGDGQGLDLTEPAKTKRITVTVSART